MTMMNFPVGLTHAAKELRQQHQTKDGKERLQEGDIQQKTEEPPVNTPNWALSAEWKEDLRRRHEQLAQAEQTGEWTKG